MYFSCPKPLVKMNISFGQCEHYDQVNLLKSRIFLQGMALIDAPPTL
jgi:hypothetical protein